MKINVDMHRIVNNRLYNCIRVLIHTMVFCPEGLAIAKPFLDPTLRSVLLGSSLTC